MTTDPKCPRCGCALRVETVKVAVYNHHEGHGGIPIRGEFRGYTEREEVSDCPRCTGSY